MIYTIVVCVLVGMVSSEVVAGECTPRNIHITLGDMFSLDGGNSDHVFTVGFTVNSTCKDVPGVLLMNSTSNLDYLYDYMMYKDVDGVLPDGYRYQRRGYFFRITKDNIKDADRWRIVGKDKVSIESSSYMFNKRVTNGNMPLKMFVVADMDISENSKTTVDRIISIKDDGYDLVVHIGDFAYEIETNNGRVGDDFFDKMSLTTTRIPYIITPGNHEYALKGRLLDYRFRMPNTAVKGTNI